MIGLFEILYKISAFWTGQEGSLLALWISQRHGCEDGFYRRVNILVLLIGIVFLSITSILSPFTSSIDGGFTEVPEDGAGLSPLLVNKWMIFHPFLFP